jgi:hypothetical protein
MLRLLIVLAAGILTAMALRQIMSGLQATKVRVKTASQETRKIKRLRQDPKTGVYFPEE